jgi:predicted regulator of Ras-like GTPase activity (Roadblock/LC7/MglB family)
MSARDVAIDEDAAREIHQVLRRFLGESSAADALLIDRSGQLLAHGGTDDALDTVSLSALTAGAFSSTAAIARLLGEPEFTMLFHQGLRESIHVAAVDEQAILLAVFDSETTVGMVRLFAKEASGAIGRILATARERPCRRESVSVPTAVAEVPSLFRRPPRRGTTPDHPDDAQADR